jgi:xanthine dehydrogenase accessory factor
MDAQDQWVIGCVCDWLQAGRRVWFCTITETVGASPRPVGSLLAVNDQGVLAGSLSGGCVEDDLLEKITAGALTSAAPRVVEYGISAEENERLGLPCGGRLRVLVESLSAQHNTLEHFRSILQALRSRQCIRRNVALESGVATLEYQVPWQSLQCTAGTLSHTLGPQYQLLLVGSGELARVLAQMAMMMDYRVLVCDPRPERVAQWSLTDVDIVQGMPDDIVREHASDSRSIVITLTHDPRIDDMALMEALQLDVFYVGALGSARTSAARRERLLQLGLTAAQVDRLHAPVGLSIHSKRPAEIAVSILAQLTALRSSV